MTTTAPYLIGKPFWQSRGVIGAVVVFLGVVLRHYGWSIDQGKLTDDISSVMELIGAAVSLYGRIVADQPIVWTRGVAPGAPFNPNAEVRKAEPVQGGPAASSVDPRRSSGGYAYPGALVMLVLCMIAAFVMVACAPEIRSQKSEISPRNPELPRVLHPSVASDLFRSLQVSPVVDVETNKAGHSIPVVTVNVSGGAEF
jgi:hypothetical protein